MPKETNTSTCYYQSSSDWLILLNGSNDYICACLKLSVDVNLFSLLVWVAIADHKSILSHSIIILIRVICFYCAHNTG